MSVFLIGLIQIELSILAILSILSSSINQVDPDKCANKQDSRGYTERHFPLRLYDMNDTFLFLATCSYLFSFSSGAN